MKTVNNEKSGGIPGISAVEAVGSLVGFVYLGTKEDDLGPMSPEQTIAAGG